MAKIFRFDKSRRTHWRSDAELKRIHAMTARAVAREKRAKRKFNWMLAVGVFVAAVIGTQLGIWEYNNIQARKLALAAIPASKIWHNCDEVRSAGVAPLFRQDPGYNSFLDADGDGIACEPYIGNTIKSLRYELWQN